MKPIKFGIVGAGWRAEFYLHVARSVENMEVVGVVARNPEKARRLQNLFSVNTFDGIEGLLDSTNPDFIVSSVSWDDSPEVLKELVGRGVPVLSETPPAPNLPMMLDLYETVASAGGKVQVAEQYWAQPHHAARLAFAASGKMGTISEAQVSVAHGYHGISLIRRFLRIGYESPVIHAYRFVSPIIAGADRQGPPRTETVKESQQVFYFLDFGDKLGVFDFTGDQYFSWIRGQRICVRGDRGEIIDTHGVYLKDYSTPVRVTFRRHEAGPEGNLEGNYLKGIQAGEEWVYRNPLIPYALSDEEIAIGTCLLRMDEYIRTGNEFYPLSEALQDHYLFTLCTEAVESGRTVEAEAQPWSRL